MRRAAGAALLAGAALAQVTWAARLEVGGAFPNLVLLAVVAVTWTLGARSGLVWACVGGVLLDLTAAGPIGPHALALLPGVYVISFWIRDLEHPNALHVALSAALTTVMYSALLVLTNNLLGMPVPSFVVAVQLALAAAVYNALLIPIAIELVRRLQMLVRSGPQPT
jgi:rod shape-determining protein MreD